MKKLQFLAFFLVFCLLLPVAATEIEQGKRTEITYRVENIPEIQDVRGAQSPEARLLLNLTMDRLYALSADGSTLTPSLAKELPQDVTAKFAGQFGVPKSAERGYAFRITLEEAAAWENGAALTSDDVAATLLSLVDDQSLDIRLANLYGYHTGAELPTEQIISLADAGFASVEEAQEAGRTEFYVDVNGFWGLSDGWLPVSRSSRAKDSAIPSGVTEMYVSGAYLYDRYLRTGAEQSVFQTEFVGVSADPTYVTREDLGIVREDAHTFVLVLEQPTTAQMLALLLSEIFVQPEGAQSFTACGAYRVVSAESEIVLEPNPHWLGKTEVVSADIIYIAG